MSPRPHGISRLLGAAVLASLVYSPPGFAVGKEARVAVIIGNNLGVGKERPLQYAEQDARRMYDLVTELGGVEKERAYLVLGGTAQDVRRAVDEAKGRIHELSRLGPTVLMVYVSAHADETSLHLEGTSLPIAALRETVRQTPATLRLVIIDACRTGAETTLKGGTAGPAVSVNLHGSEKLKGDLFIRSTGSGEPAQEWSFLGGALFTHHLVTGLRGAADVDENGRVSLSESYSYAFHQTVAGAVTAKAGPQHPSFDFNMQGFGDWTFTAPGEERSAIILDERIRGTVWVIDRDGHVVAEVDKREQAPLRLAVRPGWYRVIVPEKRTARVADVRLSFGKTRVIGDDDLVTLRLRDAMTRGDEPVVLRPFQLSLCYTYSKGAVAGLTGLHAGAFGFGFTARQWVAGIVLSAGAAEFDAVRARVTHIEGTLQARFGREVQLALPALRFGLLAAATHVWQRVVANNQEALAPYGYRPKKRTAWLPEVGLFATVAFPLTERLWLEIDGTVGARWVFMADDSVPVTLAARAGGGLGWRF
jgi:hypothetical protein